MSVDEELRIVEDPASGAVIAIPGWWESAIRLTPAVVISGQEPLAAEQQLGRMNFQVTVEAPPADFSGLHNYTREQIRGFAEFNGGARVLGLRTIHGSSKGGEWEGRVVTTSYRVQTQFAEDTELIAIQTWTLLGPIATAVTLTGRLLHFDGLLALHEAALPYFVPASQLGAVSPESRGY
ncbi:hypothetical protein FHU41_000400 [Psychromicrobium silvestre]|uniref:Uncharacterized protein n=1 Tax=Psychromicrobium silvestre TaxID=1645614 RepID=A0A7Y9LRC6_9MICC|nr:hypothetical protein [Psychromicrobium silvestre]NYE94179.1 hypothetical protein [Psychromicrobium silvestre]